MMRAICTSQAPCSRVKNARPSGGSTLRGRQSSAAMDAAVPYMAKTCAAVKGREASMLCKETVASVLQFFTAQWQLETPLLWCPAMLFGDAQ